MRQLWAPWRMTYIESDKSGPCILCQKPRASADRDNYILERTEHSFVMMNLYPYSNAHLMVSPYAHVDRLAGLPQAAALDLTLTLARAVERLRAALKAEGFNVGLNLGKPAGAGIDDHLHFHIVPRWNGDTNYMTLFAEVRVIPEHLDATYDRLLPYFREPQP
ncbi:MAG TPA: HIT domain-containing protein [Nitrospiria bacterium]|nr:HIT domain-containing protein [Nitrospiria bacterium]